MKILICETQRKRRKSNTSINDVNSHFTIQIFFINDNGSCKKYNIRYVISMNNN